MKFPSFQPTKRRWNQYEIAKTGKLFDLNVNIFKKFAVFTIKKFFQLHDEEKPKVFF